jgi:hypothetical protein
MEQYIPKSVLIAEIESLLDKGRYHEEYDCAYRDGNNGALYALKDKLDTLEVKEVNLDTDFGVCWGEYCDCGGNINDYKVAKHFFELGLKAKEK